MPLIVSPPFRRLGSRQLSPIPTEIYLEIFDHLKSSTITDDKEYNSILSSLIPVCRFFRAVARPLRFRNILLDALAETRKDNAVLNRQIAAGASAALEIATSVKACVYSNWINPSRIKEHLLSIHFRALKSMRNLHCLDLDYVTLTPSFFQAIATTISLQSLSISHCEYDFTVATADIQKLSVLQLETFSLHNCYSRDQEQHSKYWTSFSDAITSPKLRFLRTDQDAFARALPELKKDFLIEDLSFVSDSHDLLFQLIGRFPSLATLHFEPKTQSQAQQGLIMQPRSPNPILVPNLRTLKASSLELASHLLIGRPIEDLQIIGCAKGYNDSNADSASTRMDAVVMAAAKAPIRRLLVPWEFMRILQIPDNFPRLETLSVQFFDSLFMTDRIRLEHIGECVSGGSSSRTVQNLVIEGEINLPEFDISRQHASITSSLIPAFPNLRYISLASFIEWQRPYTTAPWEPQRHSFLARSSLTPERTCKFLMSTIPHGTKDYRNFYASFFRQANLPLPTFIVAS
ncbi:hypothetical protein HGRIS_013842 [Hohenbuehelia grisea]|uniref:F-box domain-containing protein n=1 Tax=Hohenbuehelia grisea TaxID=104357 RepID=A0ABR3IWM0_9AGAR